MHMSAYLHFFPLCFLLATISPRLRRATVSPVISCFASEGREACGGHTWVGKQAQSWSQQFSDGVLVRHHVGDILTDPQLDSILWPMII